MVYHGLPPLTSAEQQLNDDRWYAKSAQTYFYQKDMIVPGWVL